METKNLGLINLTHNELEQVEGGFLVLIIAGFGIAGWAFDHGVSYGQSLASHW